MSGPEEPYSRRKKICRCTPFCGKIIATQTRYKHYAVLTPDELQYKQDSVSPVTGSNDHDFVSGGSGLGDQGDEPMEDIQYVVTSDSSNEWTGDNQRDIDCEMGSDGAIEGNSNQTQCQHSMSEDSSNSNSQDSDGDLDSESESGSDVEGMFKYIYFCNGINFTIDNIFSDTNVSGLDPDLEAWLKYNEDMELEAMLSADERLKEFDVMMDVDFKDIWDIRESRV